MAGYAAEQASNPALARLAGGMVSGQQAEIDLMQDMLAARGHDPEPMGTDDEQAGGGHGEHD
jgi:uncharacterized protein (DUF305 family)